MRIYSRSEWGARYRDGYDSAAIPAPEIWAHHSVTAQLSPSASFEQEATQMRLLESIGETNFRAGISYTFCIFPSGRVYEGHTIRRAGAHTIGHNYTGRAICFIGNYEVNHLTEAQMNSAAELMVHGKALGWWKNAAFTGGHRDVYQTACPGIKAYAMIPEMNRRATGPVGGDNELDARERNALLGIETVLAPGGYVHVLLHELHRALLDVNQAYKDLTGQERNVPTLIAEGVAVLADAYTEEPGTETDTVVPSSIGHKVKRIDQKLVSVSNDVTNVGKIATEINRKVTK